MAVTALTDGVFYDNTYAEAMGEITLPSAMVNKYLIKASNEVRKRTFGNIDEAKTIVDDVKFCVCELAETMYRQDKELNGHNSTYTSEKVDDMSVNYAKKSDIEADNEREIYKIIYNYLANTGLMYCGVR